MLSVKAGGGGAQWSEREETAQPLWGWGVNETLKTRPVSRTAQGYFYDARLKRQIHANILNVEFMPISFSLLNFEF